MKTPQEVEAERNLKKALNMADGFPPPKTTEDFKFLDKWLFNDDFFYLFKENESRNNLNPRLPPRLPSETNFTGKISFCLIPCLNNDNKLQVKLKTKFKIFAHQGDAAHEDSFSLGITIPEEQLDFFTQLESHLNSAAKKMKPEISKLGQSFARFQEGDFVLVKTDKSEQEKIYAKIYPSKIPTTDFSCRFWELCESFPGGKKTKQPIAAAKRACEHATLGASRFFHQASFLRKCESNNLHCG